jgi:hypothetical protein
MATDYSTEEILNIWERGDKDTADLFTLVKSLGLDQDVDPTDWLKENLNKKGEEGTALRQYHPEWYKERLKEYYEAQEQLQTGGGQYAEGKYQDTKIEDPATGKKYIRQPGSRGASKSDLMAMESWSNKHAADMKLKEEAENKRKKEEEDNKNLSMWGKMAKHFSKDADAREKLFTYIGEMGKELVKPIEPGQAAAGALVPTLSRGLDRGQEKYQEARVAEAKLMKDLSQAQKDANPLQFYTNKMKEARYMAWNNGIDPDSAEGTSWIGNWLQTQGVASGAADLSAAIKSMSEAINQEIDPDKKKDLEKQRDRLNEQLTAIVMQSSGGGYSEEVIDYDIYK